MSLEKELKPIKKILHERLRKSGIPMDVLEINYIAESYYTLYGQEVYEEVINLIFDAYSLGYGRIISEKTNTS